MWLTLLFLGTAALFLAQSSAALFHLQWAQRLPALSDLGTADRCGVNDGRVQCSVIVAARDEESRIEDTVRHLLAQRGVELEVIVVDDRSTDRTGDWRPLAPKLVVEVQYDHFTGGRFRHGTRLLRFRPDKAPKECTKKQVEQESKVSPLGLL